MAVPGKQRARVIELLADNSTNNSSSNINKILVFGKGKDIGSGQKEILMAQKNPGEGGTSL